MCVNICHLFTLFSFNKFTIIKEYMHIINANITEEMYIRGMERMMQIEHNGNG